MKKEEHETYLRYHYASNSAVLDTTRPEEKEGLLRRLPDSATTVTEQRVGGRVVGWTIQAPLPHFGPAYEAARESSGQDQRKREAFSR